MDGAALLQVARVVVGDDEQRRRRVRAARQVAAMKRWRKHLAAGRAPTSLQHLPHSAQIRYLNRNAPKGDFLLEELAKTEEAMQRTPRGQGRWKQLTPEQVQRVVFTKASMSMASIADTHSSRHVTDLLFGCSLALCEKQATASSAFLADMVSEFCVVQLTFDEAEYRVLSSCLARSNGRAPETSDFAVHGRVLRGSLRGERGLVEEDELVLAPVAMKSNSAACTWRALQIALPEPIWQMLNGTLPSPTMQMAAMCLSCDRHAANQMLFAHLEHVSGEHILAVQGWCKQHDTGNVLEPAIRKLCFFSPAYCCAKRLRSNSFYQALLAGVKAELAEHLVWIRGSEKL